MAMGSQVGAGGDCYLACVCCSTIEDFLKSETKWFDMLQLGGQVRFCLFAWADTCSMVCVQLCSS